MEINKKDESEGRNNRPATERELVSIDQLSPAFLSLRVGENIPRLRIKEIRKVTNPGAEDNLSGVSFKYFIESRDNKVLKVSVWTLWKLISGAITKAGRLQCDLEIRHPAAGEYVVRLLDS